MINFLGLFSTYIEVEQVQAATSFTIAYPVISFAVLFAGRACYLGRNLKLKIPQVIIIQKRGAVVRPHKSLPYYRAPGHRSTVCFSDRLRPLVSLLFQVRIVKTTSSGMQGYNTYCVQSTLPRIFHSGKLQVFCLWALVAAHLPLPDRHCCSWPDRFSTRKKGQHGSSNIM